MYHFIVRRRAAAAFGALSRGEWQPLARMTAEDVHHVFPGDHALGGERHSREALVRWFERLYRVFPDITFTVKRVVSRGWPWSTWVAVEWSDRTRAGGYANDGAHWIHLRWGRATYIHAYLDTQSLAAECERVAAGGVPEAAADPIRG